MERLFLVSAEKKINFCKWEKKYLFFFRITVFALDNFTLRFDSRARKGAGLLKLSYDVCQTLTNEEDQCYLLFLTRISLGLLPGLPGSYWRVSLVLKPRLVTCPPLVCFQT